MKLFFSSLMFCAATTNLFAAIIFTNNFTIGIGDKNYDGQDIVISNCVLTVDGMHTFAGLRVAAGGALTHTASDDGTVGDFISVIGEPHVLTDTNPVTLVNSNVFTGAMLVTDTNFAAFYLNGVDYVLGSAGNGFTTLQRTTNSLIPDGDTVLVTYFYIGYASAGLNLVLTGNLEVEPGANIQANGRGFAGGQGLGVGGSSGSPQSGGGAGHGGFGGLSSSNGAGGGAYDSPFEPFTLGSGGGAGAGGIGGNGGGAIRLIVSNNFVMNGAISANGLNATNSRSGGGAGGSIWVTAQNFSGNGTITVSGGAGEPIHGGGGAGGRIAIEFGTDNFSGTAAAFGGAGWQRGGAGTVFLRTNGTPGQVTFDNGNISSGAATPLQFTNAADLIVQGRAIASVSSTQTLGSLLVRSNSSVITAATNNATLNLTIQGDATIEKGATIPLDGKGFPANQGPGLGNFSQIVGSGAGHGGYGGSGISGATVAAGGNYYGSLTSPTTFGSGGRTPSSFYPGGAGGGAVRMTVLGNLQLDGEISADATSGAGSLGGGGSGGSVWLTVGGLSGSGVISANGGNGGLPSGGGGAGGRIAIYYPTNNFTGSITAFGGNGAVGGGAGTIFTPPFGPPSGFTGSLRVDNGGLRGTNTVFDSRTTLMNLTIDGGAVLRLPFSSPLNILSNLSVGVNSTLKIGDAPGLIMTAANVNVAPGGMISADGISLSGSGSGGSSSSGSGGGGHGGYGGRGVGGAGGNAYDSISTPTSSGSPGGYYFATQNGGGGALRMTVSGLLVLDGKISSRGSSSTTNSSGGGSGGSIYLTVGGLSGAGSISADGGAGLLPNNGGGGGGRIAIYYGSNSFTGNFSAKGGAGFANGGAGTVYLQANNSSVANLTIDNGGQLGTNTVLDKSVSSLSSLTVSGGASLRVTASQLTLNQLNISTNSTLASGVSTLTMNITGSASIAPGGMITADGAGSTSGSGIGFGVTSSTGSGGGGHAGYGGRGAGATGGYAYDSASSPILTGSGGGGISSAGGAGGGVLRITVDGSLALDGKISANGLNTFSNNAGGGSGGTVSLLVRGYLGAVHGFSGAGIISADGGSGHLPNGGGGGGGRIVITYTNSFFVGTISAKGGNGFAAGGAGTIYLRTNGPAAPGVAKVIVDNGGFRGTNTSVSAGLDTFDLTVQGGAVAVNIGEQAGPRDLLIRSNAWVSQTGNITVSRNVTIETGGGIDLNGTGSGPESGTGVGHGGGGAGHGGYGGKNGGNAYGSVISPTTSGSGGANGSGSSFAPFGGSGGGAVHLTVGSVLTVNGKISANGTDGDVNSGGGSGGSLWLQPQTLVGNGDISARGGNGNGTAGGGGGGRIAITYTSNLFAGTFSACGGNGSAVGGAGTVYLKGNGVPNSLLLVDNCGLSGTNTPLSQSFGLATDISASGGAVGEFQGGLPLLSNITVASGAVLTGRATDTNLYLAIAGDLNIASGGALSLDTKGFSQTNGPGAGASLSNKGSGGGYGGIGGASSSGAIGGTNYGSATQPIDRGSGGGNGLGTIVGGSQGGGAARLFVGGTLNVDGSFTANGGDGIQDDSGGGGGGSIWVTARNLTGSGFIAADGGAGELFGGGGGGGGRIALYSPMNTFTGIVSTAGGDGAFSGSTGTIYTLSNLFGLEVISQSPVGLLSNAVSQVTLDFNEPINPASVDASDVLLYTPSGLLPANNVAVSVNGLSTLRVTFPAQSAAGDYRIEAGPGIEDLLGQAMSQVYTGAFTLTPLIVGFVTDTNGFPVSGVILQPGSGSAVMTGANGTYLLGVPPGWSGTVTPSLTNFVFVPGARSYTNVVASMTDQNYLMVPTILPAVRAGRSGANLSLSWNGISNVTYQVYSSTNLTDWQPFDVPIAGTNGPLQFLIPVSNEAQRFFRLNAQN